MNNAPNAGDGSISAKFLKQVADYSKQSDNFSINGGSLIKSGKGGMGINIDSQLPNSAHPFKVELCDYVFGEEPVNPEEPDGAKETKLTAVRLRVNTGHFIGGNKETIPEEPDLMTESDIVGDWPQKMEFGTNEHHGPYRIYWHRESFTSRDVTLKKVALPNTEVMGHNPKDIFGEYGFSEDYQFEEDAGNATNSTQTPFDEVENPMVMEFGKESWGQTFFLMLSYHNREVDGETINFEKSLPWLRLVVKNEDGWQRGFDKVDWTLIDDPEHPFKMPWADDPDFENFKLYRWRILGCWNYVVAKIVVNLDGRPFIKQYIRSDITHTPPTDHYYMKAPAPDPQEELHHPFKVYMPDPETQQLFIEPGIVNSVMPTLDGKRLDTAAAQRPSIDPPAEAGTYWIYLACYSDGGTVKFPSAVEVKLSAKDQIFLDDYDQNPEGEHDDAGFIAIASINTTFETTEDENGDEVTTQTIDIHQLVKTSLQSERHQYSQNPIPKYYFYRV